MNIRKVPDNPHQHLLQRGAYPYLLTIVEVSVMSMLISFAHADEHFANVCMLYLMGVVAVALFFGSLPAVLCSILSFFASNYFFIVPKFTLAVKDPSEWLALCAFLLVATVTGQLTALLQARAKIRSEAQALSEANRLKSALLSMVSHDFRSPLTSIKASVGSLLDESQPWDPDARRNLLQAIDEETDRLNRMVGNILDLSRLQTDTWRPKREPVSLTELIGAVLDSFSKQENERIRIHLQCKSQEILVDFVQMVQVVRNLLENALKYSPGNSMVDLEIVSEPDKVIIKVIDCGVGLPKGEEAQIFEPFYRGSQLAESSIAGTGVGLAVCRGLVEAHEGKLMAYNRASGGAVFEIHLPLADLS